MAAASEKEEVRIYVQVSADRFLAVAEGKFSLREAFNKPEKKLIIANRIDTASGDVIATYLLPKKVFIEINPIPSSYKVLFEDPEILVRQEEMSYC